MIIRHRNLQTCPFLSFSIYLILLQVLLYSSPTYATSSAKKDAPDVSVFKFERQPATTPEYFQGSDTILIGARDGSVWRSTNAGKEFELCDGIPEGDGLAIFMHKHEYSTAYVWGKRGTHYMTSDRGKTWSNFHLDAFPAENRPPFNFHAGDSKKIIVNACQSLFMCDEIAVYTLDGFKSDPTLMREDTKGCLWARSEPEWGNNFVADPSGKDDEGTDNNNRVVCQATGRLPEFIFGSRDNRLVVSDNFFQTESEPIIEAGRTVQGIINIAPVKGFLVAAASASRTAELALYISGDGMQWHKGIFPQDHRLEEGAYTMLESTNYSLQVDVMTSRSPLNPLGTLFTSNSNGTYYTRNIEHTNRGSDGLTDFEKITGIQGIVLVNVVDNWKDIEQQPLENKKVKSKISFDDGRTFDKLTTDGEELHLHSVGDLANVGKVFSSPAPGLAMGVGNTGKHLKPYEEGDLYVSDDAGVTWSKALKGPHKFELGDRGAVLVAVSDHGDTDEIQYSINHGKDWNSVDLPEKVRVQILTTTPDSTSLKFFLVGIKGDPKLREGDPQLLKIEYFTFSIDFENYHKGGKCGEDDFEKWNARVDDKGEPTCIMGHKQWFRRRKASAECFVDKEFEDIVPHYEPCPCTVDDFECDYNFIRSEDGKNCEPSGALEPSKAECRKDDDTFRGSSGWRLITGNQCDREHKDSIKLDKDEDRKCGGSVKAPANGKITSASTDFEVGFREYHYLERSDKSSQDDETVLALNGDNQLFLSRDGGKTWKHILEDQKITEIATHEYFDDIAFFLTKGKKVFYTYNRGDTFGHFKAPELATGDGRIPVINFHPEYKDWLIWIGQVDCDNKRSKCHNVARFSEDRGENWPHILRVVKKCSFINARTRGESDKLAYCEQYKDEEVGKELQLKSSDNFFASEEVKFPDVVDFATMSKFIVVAARRKDDRDTLSCHTSVDGKIFAHAEFPPKFTVEDEQAYTVLESSEAVFLHVTVNGEPNSEYGALIKSNSNGTSYAMSLENVNRNEGGYVDFERINILEGVIMATIVRDTKAADAGKGKSLQTLISHNDGATWTPLGAPASDSEEKRYSCDISDTKRCSLQLHGYTERSDTRATYSSRSAIGLMMGIGNVGEELLPKDKASTFISADGGIIWNEAKKGPHLWAYGDSGTVIVIVAEDTPTKTVSYTRDEGKSWSEYQFSDEEISIQRITTVPSGKSRNFILWSQGTGKKSVRTVNLDFSGLTDRLCELDENNPDKGDFYFWMPKHPMQKDDCLFGHKAQYHRKRLEADCYIGLQDFEKLHEIAQNCSCTREDFEWYNSHTSLFYSSS